MHYLSAAMLALSANMDNVAIGAAYGLKNIQIRFTNNLLIALLTSTGTLISMEAGATLTALFPSTLAKSLGCGVLILMGLWFVIKALRNKKKISGSKLIYSKNNLPILISGEPEIIPPETSLTSGEKDIEAVYPQAFISWKETVVLALTLAVNNLGFGIGARIAGLPILLTSLCTFFCSILLLSAGIFLGKRLHNTLLGKYTDLISGCIIIVLGLYQFFL